MSRPSEWPHVSEWPGPWPAIAAFGVALAAYAATLCPSVYTEGSGELIGATAMLGTAHPTGYPLYCLLGRFFSLLAPLGSPALRVNAFTALTGAAAAGALAAWLQARGLRPWSALAGGLLWAFSGTFWSQSVIAEVYGMAALFAVLIVAAASPPLDSPRRLVLLGLMTGMGTTTHLQVALLCPAILWLVLSSRPVAVADAVRRLAWFGGGGMLGYSPVLYLALRSGRGAGFHWSVLSDPTALWQHISGALYSSSFFSLPLEGVALNARRWGSVAAADLHPLLVPLTLWGAWVWGRRDRRTLFVWGSAAVLNLATGLQYHRDPSGLAVFFIVSLMAITVAAARGLDDFAARLSRGTGLRWAPIAVALLPVALVAVEHWPESDRSSYGIAQAYGRDVLDSLPPRAILITEGDHVSYIVDYLWRVEGVRRDVEIVNRLGRGGAPRMRRPEGSAGLAPGSQAAWERRQILQSGLPVCYTVAHAMPVRGYGFAPAGLVYQAVPADRVGTATHTFPDSLLDRLSQPAPDAWSRRILAEYWFMRAEHHRSAGRRTAAAKAYEAAAQLAFDARTVRYNVSVMSLRDNRLRDALRHAQAASAIDPMRPEPLRLIAAIHEKLGNRTEARQAAAQARALAGSP